MRMVAIMPVRKSTIRSLKYKFPVVGFIGWCFLVAFLVVSGVLFLIHEEEDAYTVPVVLLIIGYLIYLIMIFVQPVFRATFHKMDVGKFDTHLQELRNTGVDLHFEIVASHTEHHTYRDSNGNKRTETRTVVTYRGTRYVPVPFWVDLTGPVVLPPGSPYLRILNMPKIEWCHDSERIIESIRKRIYFKNQHRDKNVTVTTHYGVPGLKPNLVVRSPLMDPTTFQKVRINPCLGILLTILGFGGHHSLIISRSLPVVKHKVHKKASLVQPVVDDRWLKQYKVKGATMTPAGAVFGNVQMVDTWEPNVPETYQPSQPMFVNPMPLYVPYNTAVQYEVPTAPEMPYMYYDPNQAQTWGPGSEPWAGCEAPSAPSAPATYDDNTASAPLTADQNASAPYVDPNAGTMAAAPGPYPGGDPNTMAAAPGPYPGQDPNAVAYPGQDPNSTIITSQ